MRLAIDMTVCREPASGVQLTVQRAVQAELPYLRNQDCLVYATTDEPRDGCQRVPLSSSLRHPVCRIAWQQMVLPGELRRRQVEVLQAMAYTMPLRCDLPTMLVIHDLIALEHPEFCSLGNRLQMQWLLTRSARRASVLTRPWRTQAARPGSGSPWPSACPSTAPASTTP